MSYCKCYFHIVFATKGRKPLLHTEDIRRQVYAILYKLCQNKGITVIRIGGYVDHVHLLLNIPTTVSVASMIQYLKGNVSACIKENHIVPMWMGWNEGYGCFTVHYQMVEVIRNYIMHQEEHHKTHNFIDEYRKLLIDNGVSEDEPFFPSKSRPYRDG